MESYGTVSKDSISLKPLQEQKALKHLEKQSNTKTTDTLSETYGRKISHHYYSTNHYPLSQFSSLERKFE